MNAAYGRWGQLEDDPAPGGESLSTWEAFSKALTVGEFLATSLQDKFLKVEKLKQRVVDAKLSGMPAGHIANLEAQLAAAERAYAKQLESEASTRQYRLLGQVGALTGIMIGGSVVFYILTRALR